MIRLLPFILLAIILVGGGYMLWQTQDEGTSKDRNVDLLSKTEGYEVSGEAVEYFPGTTGFFARPNDDKNYPGIVMIHEWWGLNDNIRAMAKNLASEGYIVLAVDLFGSVAETPDEARKLTGSLDKAKALNNMKAAIDYLKDQGAPKVGSLGWCFGGGQSLALGVGGEEDLAVTVIYYGQLTSDTQALQNIKWPVLGIFGEKDTSIPVSSVTDFETALNTLGIQNQIHIYPGVGHAFANPSGQNYAPEETKDAWSKTLAFLKKNL